MYKTLVSFDGSPFLSFLSFLIFIFFLLLSQVVGKQCCRPVVQMTNHFVVQRMIFFFCSSLSISVFFSSFLAPPWPRFCSRFFSGIAKERDGSSSGLLPPSTCCVLRFQIRFLLSLCQVPVRSGCPPGRVRTCLDRTPPWSFLTWD